MMRSIAFVLFLFHMSVFSEPFQSEKFNSGECVHVISLIVLAPL